MLRGISEIDWTHAMPGGSTGIVPLQKLYRSLDWKAFAKSQLVRLNLSFNF